MIDTTVLRHISTDVAASELFTKAFKEVMDDLGEPYFEPLPADQVLGTFSGQGFYSGTKYRIYWSVSNGFTVEEKRYG